MNYFTTSKDLKPTNLPASLKLKLNLRGGTFIFILMNTVVELPTEVVKGRDKRFGSE